MHSILIRRYVSNLKKDEMIRTLLKTGLSADHVAVTDTSGGCGDFFSIVVVSKLFEGKPLLEQHKMVNKLIKGEFESLHGITLKTVASSKFNFDEVDRKI